MRCSIERDTWTLFTWRRGRMGLDNLQEAATDIENNNRK